MSTYTIAPQEYVNGGVVSEEVKTEEIKVEQPKQVVKTIKSLVTEERMEEVSYEVVENVGTVKGNRVFAAYFIANENDEYYSPKEGAEILGKMGFVKGAKFVSSIVEEAADIIVGITKKN